MKDGRRRRAGTALAVLALLAAGCGSDGATTADSQVIARVNDAELTLTQLEYQLSRDSGDGVPEAQRQRHTLAAMVDQELLRQKAVEAQLDRNPDVLLRIEAARSRILADAYVQHRLLPQTPLRPEDIETYYDANPALFRERRRYRLSVFTTVAPVPPALLESLSERKSAREIGALLDAAGIGYEMSSALRYADQLPLSVVKQFASAQPGDVVALAAPGGAALSLVEGFEEAGVSIGTARLQIENYLLNLRNQDTYAQSLRQLREGATLEYLGAFAAAATQSNTTEGHPTP